MPVIQIAGRRFGRLLAISRAESDKNGNSKWLCRCDCGAEKLVMSQSLRSGKTVSCGCFNREINVARCTTHGAASTTYYKAWHAMHERCRTPTHHKWHRYGARGIRVCDRWSSFETFRADMGPRPAGLSLDRINNDGNYEPGNCRWSTPLEQASNRANNVRVEVRGRSFTASQASRLLGDNRSTVSRRIRSGWNPLSAATTPMLNQGEQT